MKSIMLLILISTLIIIGVPQIKWVLMQGWDFYQFIFMQMSFILKNNFYAVKVNQFLSLWVVSILDAVLLFFPSKLIFKKIKVNFLEFLMIMIFMNGVIFVLHQ